MLYLSISHTIRAFLNKLSLIIVKLGLIEFLCLHCCTFNFIFVDSLSFPRGMHSDF
jgi:hypothetical protein